LEFFPGIDVSYWVSDNVKLFGSVNKALRMPTFTEMFYSGPVNIGNPDLKPEEGVTYEAGAGHVTGFMDNKVSLFYRDSRNLIDWGRMEGEEKYVTRNLSDMNTFGIGLSSSLDLEALFEERSFFVKRLNLSYNYIYQDKRSMPGYESVYVMDYLKNKLVFGADLRIISKLGANIGVVYRDRNGYYTAYEHVNGDYIPVQVPYDPFVTVDMRLMWTALKYMLFVDVDNMFNKKYYDIGNVLQPGIWIKAGVKFNLIYE
jgi:iron complex outermembrane receptor protein